MNKNEIDQLLSKFYRGETTLDEEQQLRNVLNDDSVDALLMKELEAADDIEVPANLESNLSDLVDLWEANEQQEAKIAPPMWRRSSWWAVAASVAVIATVGLWFMRNRQQPAQPSTQQPVIAQVEEPITPPAIEEVTPAETLPEQQSAPQPQPQPEVKPRAQQPSPMRMHKNKVEHLAQAQVKPQVKTQAQAQPELSADDEELALAALEKFSTTLNRGFEQLSDADETINNINNTIKQLLL